MGNAIEHSDERIRVDSYYSFYLEGESNVNYKNRKEDRRMEYGYRINWRDRSKTNFIRRKEKQTNNYY